MPYISVVFIGGIFMQGEQSVDGGITALAGYLYQILGVLGMRER
jgi:hypothetical protein